MREERARGRDEHVGDGVGGRAAKGAVRRDDDEGRARHRAPGYAVGAGVEGGERWKGREGTGAEGAGSEGVSGGGSA